MSYINYDSTTYFGNCYGYILFDAIRPNMDLLQKLNVNFNQQTFVTNVHENSLNTKVVRIYLAGSIIAGKDSNKIFIENGR